MGEATGKPWWQPAATVLSLALDRLPTPALRYVVGHQLRRRAARLPAEEALRLLLEVDRRLYHLTGKAAIRYGGGVHTKHRHLDYHRFFVERIEAGQSVLDVGCGNGAVARDVAERAGASVLGIDYSESSIAAAQRDHAHERVEFVLGDALTDIPDRRFGVVMLSNVLEHLRDRPAVLRELVKNHEPERVLIRVPCYDRDWRVPLRDELGIDPRLDEDHKIEYTQATFRQEMAEAGLVVESLDVRWGEIYSQLRPAGEPGAPGAPGEEG